MEKIYKPWINAYDENCKDTISYFEGSYSAMVEDAASKYPNVIAYEFMGKKVKYKKRSGQPGSGICRADKTASILCGRRLLCAAIFLERQCPLSASPAGKPASDVTCGHSS